jgi:hypothetical protein
MRRTKSASNTVPETADAAHIYAVGYSHPPLHTRFKPGTSGNPRGRPRRHQNFRTIVKEVANETVTLREGDRIKTVTKLRALVVENFHRALKGDPKAAAVVLQILRGTGYLDEEPTAEAVKPEETDIVLDFLQRSGFQQRLARRPHKRRRK